MIIRHSSAVCGVKRGDEASLMFKLLLWCLSSLIQTGPRLQYIRRLQPRNALARIGHGIGCGDR